MRCKNKIKIVYCIKRNTVYYIVKHLAQKKCHKAIPFIVVLYVLLGVPKINAQELPVSQYFNNLVLLNPAYAGNTGQNRVNSYFRMQAPHVTLGLQSYGVSYDVFYDKWSSGLGVVFENQVLGERIAPSAGLIYSYSVRALKQLFITNAVQFNVYQNYLQVGNFDEGYLEAMGSESYLETKYDVTIGGGWPIIKIGLPGFL
jgi:hypothetical protein